MDPVYRLQCITENAKCHGVISPVAARIKLAIMLGCSNFYGKISGSMVKSENRENAAQVRSGVQAKNREKKGL